MGKNFYNLEDVLSTPILDVCEAYGVLVEKRGSSCFCKLRPERTASCKLYLNNDNGHDSFFDFGSNVGGTVINFVAECLGSDWQTALEDLATRFDIQPQNNSDYIQRNELSDLEYKKIGVYGDLATKNFDFDIEKYSLESAQKFSEKYSMPVNQLRKDYPDKYVNDILKKRAIPCVYTLRNEYYFKLYVCLSFQKALLGNFDINRVPENDMKECEMLCKQLVQAEKLLKKALRGTDVNYSFKDYNILSDMKKIWYGEISFEIGDKTYAEIKRDSHVCGVDLYYRSVSLKEYMDLKEYGINFVSHAAFLKNDMVNLVFLPDQSHLIDLCIGNYKKSQDLEKEKSFEQDNAPKISENDVNKTVRTVLTEER